MPSIGLSEILVISLIAILIIKPKDIPRIARKAGRFLRMFREYRSTLLDEVNSLAKLETPDKGENKQKTETETEESRL